MAMRNHFMLLLVILALISISSAHPARAHWIEDGVQVNTDPSGGGVPVIAPDGMGGAFIAWLDQRNGNVDLYAQRLSVSGTPLWTSSGVPICTDPSGISDPAICADGVGGAIIVWSDLRNGNTDLYAQRIGPNGTRRWTANGIPICIDTNVQQYAHLVPDGAGGAIIVWEDWRNGSIDVYAQRIDVGGYVWWTYNGVAVCTAATNQNWIRAAADGAGGAVISWADARNGNLDVYAQRIDGSGASLWTAGGVGVCTATAVQGNPDITGDGGGGAIITWQDGRNGNMDIFAQRIGSGGTAQWTANGVAIASTSYSEFYSYIASDDAGGAIIVFLNDHLGNTVYQVYVQRVNGAGTVQWTTNGVQLSARPVYQWEARIASDGAGGAIACWQDYGNIRAQRVDAAGTPQWPADGVLICAAADLQQDAHIATNGAGGAIITWQDNRSGTSNIWAGNVEADGQLYNAEPAIASVDDIPADQGGEVYLSWEASRDESLHGDWVTEYTIWRAIEPSAAVAMFDRGGVLLSSENGIPANLPKGTVRIERLGAATYYWQLIETQDLYYQNTYGVPLPTLYDSTSAGTGYHFFQVVAQTADPMVFWASAPDSGYSVDNLAPCPPVALSGEQSFMPEGLRLTWNPNAEGDLDGYRVYRGTSEGFTPEPGNLLAAVCDTTLFDSGWTWDTGFWYKVAAVDVHGNESGYAVLGPSEVTGDESPRVPEAAFLSQNYPNPFNPSTTIRFGVRERTYVSLRIYDTAGRLVRVLTDELREAGSYEAFWDGRDDGGMRVASGVYFYRLRAGAFSRTNKMVLLR
jgi:hypothetical protein